MELIPKLCLLKRPYSTKSDLCDIHQGSCSHTCIVPFWALISNENNNLAMIQGWCWPEECGRFHKWANPLHGCSSSTGGSLVPGPCRVPPPGPTTLWDAEGGNYQQMSLVEHWEMRHRPGTVQNTSWWSSDCTKSTRKHTGKKTWSFRVFLFFLLFLFIALPAILGRENFQTLWETSSNFLLWNISVAILGKEGIAGEHVQPSLLILRSAFLAVGAKFTLRKCVLGERFPVQVPLYFHLNAKTSLSSRKWHVLKDLSTWQSKIKDPSYRTTSGTQSSERDCVRPLAEAFTEALLKQGKMRLYPQLTNLDSKRHHCFQTLDSRLKGLLFWTWRAVQNQKPKVCFHLITSLKKKKKLCNNLYQIEEYKKEKQQQHGIDLPKYKCGLSPRLPLR